MASVRRHGHQDTLGQEETKLPLSQYGAQHLAVFKKHLTKRIPLKYTGKNDNHFKNLEKESL